MPRTITSRARRHLHLFAGRGGRLDGLAALGVERGDLVDEVDIEIGGAAHNLCTDTVFQRLHDACSGGYYVCMVAGICSRDGKAVRHLLANTYRPTLIHAGTP